MSITEPLGFFEQLWQDIGMVFDAMITNLTELPAKLDAINFTSESSLYKMFGMIHYVLGTPLFIFMSVLLGIGVGLIFYKITQYLINVIQKIFGNSKLKIFLP